MADLDVAIDDHVMTLTINRPDARNAIGGSLLRELLGAIERAREDDEIHVLVTGAVGDKYWCSGADIQELERVRSEDVGRRAVDDGAFAGSTGLSSLSEQASALDELGIGRWILAFSDVDKPMIAAVNGWAVGGGLGLCMLHDIRIASTRARFASGFVTAGLGPEYGLSVTVPQAIGSGAAADLLFSGRTVEAEEALRLGLVKDIVEPAALHDHAMDFARSIAMHQPLAIRSTKRALALNRDELLRDRLIVEWRNQLACLAPQDAPSAE